MRSLISLVVAFLLTGALVAEESIPAEKDVISFDAKLGTVTFRHKAHSDMTITQCSTCHHTYTGEAAVKPCGDCHVKKSTTAPSKMKAFHIRCAGCHQYTVKEGKTAGPLKKECKLCHVK